ncbi:hypothetical protein D3C75_1344630 [compost metagenome]
MRDVSQHAAHRLLQLAALGGSPVIDIQQPVQIGQQKLQLRTAAHHQQPLMRAAFHNALQLVMDVFQLACLLP